MGRVELADCVARERRITGGRIIDAFCVAKKGERSIGRVVAASSIARERKSTGGRVVEAFGVAKEGERSIGCVGRARGVAQKRPGASGRVWSAVLARSVPAPVAVLKLPVVRLRSEYTNRIIVDAGGEAPKGEVPFRGVASRVASIWRRTDGLRLLRKREARKHQGNENGEKCPGLSDLS